MTEEQPEKPVDASAAEADAPSHVVIVGPDGQQVALPTSALQPPADDNDESDLTSLVEQPAKVMRIGSMIRQLLEEVKAAPLDEASRQRLKEIYRQSIKELESGLAPELVEELERLTLPFTGSEAPTDAELRISQAQLVGWLEGLFHGIQATLFAQQLAAQQQLQQIRGGPGQLPPGATPALMPHNFAQPVRLIPLGRVQVFRLRGFGRAEEPREAPCRERPATPPKRPASPAASRTIGARSARRY